jgi:hypothetical protein
MFDPLSFTCLILSTNKSIIQSYKTFGSSDSSEQYVFKFSMKFCISVIFDLGCVDEYYGEFGKFIITSICVLTVTRI